MNVMIGSSEKRTVNIEGKILSANPLKVKGLEEGSSKKEG